MQVPKRKTSKSKRNMRRSHHALTPGRTHSCPNCGGSVKSHHVCLSCGQYRGRQLLQVEQSE
ncbi:MAG: 50S ribosomal protein L32 [Bdellovibrionales bacterium]|nr:50S ribosomal protein L32 [Bdellovibrionales bacterium]